MDGGFDSNVVFISHICFINDVTHLYGLTPHGASQLISPVIKKLLFPPPFTLNLERNENIFSRQNKDACKKTAEYNKVHFTKNVFMFHS